MSRKRIFQKFPLEKGGFSIIPSFCPEPKPWAYAKGLRRKTPFVTLRR